MAADDLLVPFLGAGIMLKRIFQLPAWATPAITFNNTTSLPLLLVQSRQATRILDRIDSSGEAVERAKSYFLINASICNSLTFIFGPMVLAPRLTGIPRMRAASLSSPTTTTRSLTET